MIAIETDDGIEISDGEELITISKTWPPKDPEVVSDLLSHAGFDQDAQEVLKILLGRFELQSDVDNREE